MSETIRVYGGSDDLVEVEGKIDGADEYTTSGNWRGVLAAPNGDTMILYVDYRENGTWTVAVGQWDEDYDLPLWPKHFQVETDLCPYSTLLIMDVPDGTTLRELAS